jgi:murein DD-endopeptidase MepM/ murein hydrolase activator NlpD
MHWFNPIMIWISSEISKLCELACDEKVIGLFNSSEKQKYGETLLSLAFTGSYKNGESFVTMFTEKKNMKERLVSIMNHQKKSKSMIAIMCIVTTLIVASSVTLGAAAINNPSTYLLDRERNSSSVPGDDSTNNDTTSLADSTMTTIASYENREGNNTTASYRSTASTKDTAPTNATNTTVQTRKSRAYAPNFVLCLPLNNNMVSSPYGTILGKKHTGVDMPGSINDAVYASASGTVTLAGYNDEDGNYVEIKHNNGEYVLYTYYAHLNALNVTVGQEIEATQTIGTLGNTGNSTEPHLHFEVRKDSGNGNDMNPNSYLTFVNTQ